MPNNSFIIIDHVVDNPYFNLAAEEYLLHQFDQNIIFTYVNQASVVIGKHQNAFDECQLDFCSAHNIQIARRLSGGGTVFHGPGNLNFCFIKNGQDSTKLIDFKKHLTPINEFLHSLNIDSVYSGRNDLLVDGFKVSGNAEHVFNKKKRVIHHGTLLFDADLHALSASIAPKTHMRFETHAVKSVRSKVKNLNTFLTQPIDFKTFNNKLTDFLTEYFNAVSYQFTSRDLAGIQELMDTKYRTWDWIFGYSPKCTVEISLDNAQRMALVVTKGMIQEATSANEELDQLIKTTIGKSFSPQTFESLGFSIQF